MAHAAQPAGGEHDGMVYRVIDVCAGTALFAVQTGLLRVLGFLTSLGTFGSARQSHPETAATFHVLKVAVPLVAVPRPLVAVPRRMRPVAGGVAGLRRCGGSSGAARPLGTAGAGGFRRRGCGADVVAGPMTTATGGSWGEGAAP